MAHAEPGPGLNRSGRPNLRARLVRLAFKRSPATAPADHWKAAASTKILEDLDYRSSLPDGKLDLHLPLETGRSNPLVLLIHGGAFIGGDKLDNRIYAVELAARGWAVANLNYSRAPESRYPSPLVQIDEAYRFLSARAQELGLDMERIFLAGDSAGAHMMAQYALIQTDAVYASGLGFSPRIPAASIRGVLLFCGPYNLSLMDDPGLSPPIRAVFRFLGDAYFGRRGWQGSPEAAQASLIGHLGPAFPPTFITDGNTWSFEEQGRALAAGLRASGVPLSELFHDKGKGWLGHEYQYILDSPAGQKAFEAVLEFLAQWG